MFLDTFTDSLTKRACLCLALLAAWAKMSVVSVSETGCAMVEF